MWESVVNMLIEVVNAAFGWITTIFNSVPGSWDTLFTVFVIFMIARYLLGPVLGFAFSAGSDRAKSKSSSDGE